MILLSPLNWVLRVVKTLDAECRYQEQVEQAVRYMKYPSKRWPKGMRGAGTIFAPPVFNQDDGDYLKTANENTIFIAQIETRLGVENCEKIASIDGVGILLLYVGSLLRSIRD